jgi:MFS superfamily sulfate permease-like transporter
LRFSAWPSRAKLRADAAVSIVVFLVALPLCLRIAHASDAPRFAGIVTESSPASSLASAPGLN